jgi:phospholipid/cholesterol/gamma-HCH transport system substrate-binding protein
VAGIAVGTVDDVRVVGTHAVVDMTLEDVPPLGDRTTASLALDTLLGQHSVALESRGSGTLAEGATIPLSRTTTPFGVTDALQGTANELQPINTRRLTKALGTISGALDSAAPQVRTAATGLSALSRVVSERDHQVRRLFAETAQISSTLAQRSDSITRLIDNGGRVLVTLDRRQRVIRALLRDTGRLAATVKAVIDDSRGEITPAMKRLRVVLRVLRRNQANLDESLRLMAPYLRYFTNVVGNGRWFDGYVAGLVPPLVTSDSTGSRGVTGAKR